MAAPRVDFYHDVDDKLAVTARLAQKALSAGLRTLIDAGDRERAGQIDRALWCAAPLSFLAHVSASSPLAGETPIVILQDFSPNATSGFDLLINAGDRLPEGLSSFRRVIEIVGHDDADKARARERYRAYRAEGCELMTHRLGAGEA